ncbi:MAG: protoporphyrinogen oxidase HemJ [Pseudomonadota bacterium]
MFGSIDLWVKSAHILAVISWMAALLYLPRLFIYHCDAEIGSVQSETFKIMERRLLKAIGTPAMIATWIFGIWIATLYSSWSEPWMWVKLVCVVIITAMHMAYAKYRKAFEEDRNEKPQRFYRIANEVPAVLMIIIVIMVVVKPF